MDRWKKLKDLAIVATVGVAAVGISQQRVENVQAATTAKAKKPASQLTQAQNAQKAAQKKLMAAEENKKTTEKTYNLAKATYIGSEKKYLASKAVQENAKQAHDYVPKIVANNEIRVATQNYAKAIREYFADDTNTDSTKIDQAEKAWSKALVKGKDIPNEYVGLDQDQKVKIDLNNLTVDQQNQLTNYAVEVINSARSSFGMNQFSGGFVASKGAIAAASEIAKKYSEDKWDSNKNGHDNKVVNEVASEYGLMSIDNSEGQAIENLSTQSGSSKLTMFEAKRFIYESILGMLYDDASSENGHAKSLLGLDDQYYMTVTRTKQIDLVYFGLSTDGYIPSGSKTSENFRHLHFIVVPNIKKTTVQKTEDSFTTYLAPIDNENTWESKSGNITLPNPYDPSVLQANLNKANMELAPIKADFDAKKASFQKAKQSYDNAKVVLKSAKAIVNKANKAVATAKKRAKATSIVNKTAKQIKKTTKKKSTKAKSKKKTAKKVVKKTTKKTTKAKSKKVTKKPVKKATKKTSKKSTKKTKKAVKKSTKKAKSKKK